MAAIMSRVWGVQPRTPSGLVTPFTTDWVDLLDPVPSASAHAAGLHAYTHDIAAGPRAAATATTVSNDSDGLWIATGTAGQARVIDRRLACAAELDPVVSFVYRHGAHTFCGMDDESAPDVAAGEYLSAAWGASVDASAVYACARSQSAAAAAHASLVGSWYRVDIHGGATCTAEFHLLPSGIAADWDMVNLVRAVSRSYTAGGSSILYPVWATSIAGTDRVRAIRVTPRRS